jgi:alpha-tubulin suppressor-like RCC1 family protein
LKSDGTVWAWGNNNAGQLGDGTTNYSVWPIQSNTPTNITAIAVGHSENGQSLLGTHNLALRNDGTVWSWGSNGDGQLGYSTMGYYYSKTPTQISNLSNVTAVAAGGTGYIYQYQGNIGFSMALKSNGTVVAWGDNYFGELGNGTTTNSTSPVSVSSLTNIVAIAAGNSYGMALKNDGTVWTWGSSGWGQLGNNAPNTGNYTSPVQVQIIDPTDPTHTHYLTGIVAISAGNHHALALKSDGTVWAWGDNWYNQLGYSTGSTSYGGVAAQVTDTNDTSGYLTGITAIAAGGQSNLALKSDTTLRCWGANYSGQLGNYMTLSVTSPDHVVDPATPGVQSSYFSNVIGIAVGQNWSMAITSP